jgi:chromosome segregation ATPase
MSEIYNFVKLAFSLDEYKLHANRMNLNSSLKNMLINLYSNLLDFAKDETNPNRYDTFKEIIKQFNVVAISAPLNNQIENLQYKNETLNATIETLNATIETLNAKNETLNATIETLKAKNETLKSEIQTLHQRY